MNNNTPGPWVAELYEGGAFDIRPFGEDGPILAGRNAWHEKELEMAANARLIAAAPEMYDGHRRNSERPKEAISMMEREGFVINNLDDRWQKLAFTLYTMLVESASDSDALIAKADGKE
jgi:hypothetical protein